MADFNSNFRLLFNREKHCNPTEEIVRKKVCYVTFEVCASLQRFSSRGKKEKKKKAPTIWSGKSETEIFSCIQISAFIFEILALLLISPLFHPSSLSTSSSLSPPFLSPFSFDVDLSSSPPFKRWSPGLVKRKETLWVFILANVGQIGAWCKERRENPYRISADFHCFFLWLASLRLHSALCGFKG